MRVRTARGLVAATLITLLTDAGEVHGQTPADTLRNPFAGFETWILDNGLKVWYGPLPGAERVSVSVAVPYGRDHDPRGKEQLAHFTEHMLFGDQPGKTEEEIRREIEERGGDRNGITASDHTWYYVTIGREHGLFALEWLHGILSPHDMDPEVVERNRRPVALEIGARPPELFDRLLLYYIDPLPLRVPGFWEREFGLETRRSRQVIPWRSLGSIGPDDLRWFYETYYVPSRMTLTVVGDLPRDSVRRVVERTFGTLPARSAPEVRRQLRDPGRFRGEHFWTFRPDVRYRDRYKVYRPTGAEHVELVLLEQLLERRLNRKLRFGERKAVYGIQVSVDQRGPAHLFEIRSRIRTEALDSARAVIAAELDTLRRGLLPDSVFRAERDALARTLRTRYSSAEPLNFLALRYFYDRELHRDFPDLVAAMTSLTPEDLAGAVDRHLARERRVLRVIHPQPMTQGLLVLLAAALAFASVRAARRLFLRPAPMRRLRYVARFRLASVPGVLLALTFVVAVAGAGRLLAYGFQLLSMRWLVTVESYPVQMAGYGLMGVMGILFLVTALSRVPRKLLVFDDHVRIKYLSYRSRELRPDQVVGVSVRRFPDVWLTRRILGTVPLTLGVRRPGVHLETSRGPDYFVAVRDPVELADAIRSVL